MTRRIVFVAIAAAAAAVAVAAGIACLFRGQLAAAILCGLAAPTVASIIARHGSGGAR